MINYIQILYTNDWGSLQIMPKIVNWRRWRRALPGSCPPRNMTTQAGILSRSFWSLCSLTLTNWSRMPTSVVVRTSKAIPENSTGNPEFAERIIAGLAQCPFARPAGNILNSDFLYAVNLERMWGRFPSTDLRIPTCSAYSTNLIGSPVMLMHDVNLAMEASSCEPLE